MLRASTAVTAAQETATRLTHAQRLARMVHWQVGADGEFAWASDPLAVFWPDVPPDQARRLHLLALVHPDDRARVEAALAAPASHDLDFRLRLPDGTECQVHQDAELYLTDRGSLLIGATQDVTSVRRAEEQIAQLAFYDDLTGLPNRQFVDAVLRRVTDARPRAAIAIDLGLAHLEHLTVDVRHGLTRAAAARDRARVRGADLEVRLDQAPRSPDAFAGETVVARTGADELLVVTTQADPAAIALPADALRAPFVVGGIEYAPAAPRRGGGARSRRRRPRARRARPWRDAARRAPGAAQRRGLQRRVARPARPPRRPRADARARARRRAPRPPPGAHRRVPPAPRLRLDAAGRPARAPAGTGVRDPLAFAAVLEAEPRAPPAARAVDARRGRS